MRGNQRQYSFESPYVLAIALILAATIFLVLMGGLRQYRSTVSVLVVPKSPALSAQTDEVLENIMDMSRRLSFYEKLLSDNPGQRDFFAGRSLDERKRGWNRMFDISRGDQNTILDLTVDLPVQGESLEMSRKAAFALISTASRYYNVRTDVDFRIIEGPVARAVLPGWYWLLGVSVLLGYVLAFLINYIAASVLGKLRRTAISQKSMPDLFQNFSFSNVAVRPEEADYPVTRARRPAADSVAKIPQRQASAPANLPVAEEYVLPAASAAPVSEPELPAEEILGERIIAEEEPARDENREPSEEEYRRRLNALMRGEF